jgi:D-3-phosphoglycerate dehydrogenase / 2-oxoglutarate reductase
MTDDSIYVTLSTFAEYDEAPLARLRSSGIPFTLNPTGKRVTREQLLEEGREATVAVAGVESYDAAMLAALPRLRCISRCGVGVDAIDLAAARERRITVLNTPDVPTQAVAELTLAMILGLSRQIARHTDQARRREWTRRQAHLVAGRTVGLIGFGRIGRRVAELLIPFGAAVLASDPAVAPEAARARGVELTGLEALLSRADIVSVHAAASGGAVVLGPNELASMKPGAMLVNVARGSMVDEGALLEALRSGHLFGAALDVYGREPYDGPLCDLPNVILTPHSATLTVETRVAMELECVDKAVRFVEGRIEPHEVVA